MKTILKSFLHDNYSIQTLRLMITLVCLIILIITWAVDNALILAGILAYEVLP